MSRKSIKISKHIPSALQARLDFSAASTFPLVREHPLERLLLKSVIALLLLLACGYLYFVSASILNVIARREAMAEIARLQSVISVREQEYFALAQAISPEAAAQFGLSPALAPEYVYRPGNTVAATIGANEI